MSFHIGKLIKQFVKQQNLSTNDVREAINASKQTVYKVYKRKIIDSDKLIKLSVKLKLNLFSFFQDHELLKDLPNPKIQNLEKEIEQHKLTVEEQNKAIIEKDKRLQDLEKINAYQQKEIDDLEKLKDGKE
jgi:hypothetical protein